MADAWLCLVCPKDKKPAFLVSPAQPCIPCEMVTPCGKLLGYTYEAARGESISSALGGRKALLSPRYLGPLFSLLEIHPLLSLALPLLANHGRSTFLKISRDTRVGKDHSITFHS